MRVPWHTCVCVKGQLMGVIYLFLSLGSQESNCGIFSMQQVPWLTETCPVSISPAESTGTHHRPSFLNGFWYQIWVLML